MRDGVLRINLGLLDEGFVGDETSGASPTAGFRKYLATIMARFVGVVHTTDVFCYMARNHHSINRTFATDVTCDIL